jgi:ubiquinone/menaquinone biosynthesis C-methylase UbiE
METMEIGRNGSANGASKDIARDEMNWDAYAKQYDILCDLNPVYHENVETLLTHMSKWGLPNDARICDLGAGTGNFIVAMAENFPSAQYWHVDTDSRMLSIAKQKYESRGLSQIQIVQEPAENTQFPADYFDLILCVNALYAFPDKDSVLASMRSWLKPTGKLFLIDFGRKQRTLDWTFYIFKESLKSGQVGRYVKGLLESREVLKQNRKATKGQKSGRYWLHSTEEFGESLRQSGFKVEELRSCYRGYADFAICTK